jgi:hypothetical protein
MTFLRNLQHDLVDKKLWPLALILVLALIAVPVLLGGGGSEPTSGPAPGATAAPPTATASAASPSVAEVAVAVEEPVLRKRKGSTRDPFKQQYAPKTLTTPPPDDSAAPTTGTGDTKAPSDSGSGDTQTTPSTTEPKKETPDVDPLDVYRVSLRFGEPGEQKTIRDIARLSPLPNADRPFFVFLGVLSGGKKAVFLISSDATATGDGSCRPSKANCETVELEKGETEFFDLETESGVVQYQLDLVTLKRRVPLDNAAAVAAQAKARAAAARKAAARRKKARELAAKKGTEDPGTDDVGSDRYRWDEKRGVLVRRVKSSKVSMNVGGGLIGVLQDAGDGLVALADGSWQAGDPAADDAPAVVGGP